MKSYYFILISLFLFFGFFVFAQDNLEGVVYPIPELGNCESKDDCAVFCDLPENAEACLDFSEAHGLISSEDLAMARKMLEIGDMGGPGGCKGKAECETYCDNPDHMEECIIFAKKYGLIPPEELEDVEKVLAAIEKGATPPPCHGKAACDAYCNMAEHFEECITFGEAAGLIPPEELGDAKKALEAVRKGAKPPACKGKAECDVYCQTEEHFQECLTFAEAAGFISSEDAAMARKTGGKGPGGCRGEEECNAFCEEPANMKACIEFGLEYGVMPAEDVESAKKTLQALEKGVSLPNCRGEECKSYCSQPEHMEECLNFSEAAGFITPEEAQKARQGPPPSGQQGPPPSEGVPSEEQPPEGMMGTPPEGMIGPPSAEEIERMKQEGMQRAMEEIQKSIPGGGEGLPMMPPGGVQFPEGAPIGPPAGGTQPPTPPSQAPAPPAGGGGEAP